MLTNKYMGVDLGATHVRVGVVEEGRITHLQTEAIGSDKSEKDLLDRLLRMTGEQFGDDVRGIGMGVPSVVDTQKGIVYDVQNIPSWKEVPLKRIMEDRFNCDVCVNNDANCFALGEYLFGKGKSYQSLIGLILGTGFAGGIIISGRIYEGANCGAGEFGMVPYRSSILEHYCSGQFFERSHGTTGEKLFEEAKKGSGAALDVFREYGRHLAVAVKAVLYTFDPEIIVFGGSVSKAYPLFRESMNQELGDFAYRKSLENLTIELSENEQIAVLGAAALCLDNDHKSEQ